MEIINKNNNLNIIIDNDDERMNLDLDDLDDFLRDEGIVLSKEQIKELLQIIKNSDNFELEYKIKESKTENKKEEDKAKGGFDIIDDEEEDEEEDTEESIPTDTVGKLFNEIINKGYSLLKAKVSRGYATEIATFVNGLRGDRYKLCGPDIKLLKVICNEISPKNSGCDGRKIIEQKCAVRDDMIAYELLLNENIVVNYVFIKSNNNDNDDMFEF